MTDSLPLFDDDDGGALRPMQAVVLSADTVGTDDPRYRAYHLGVSDGRQGIALRRQVENNDPEVLRYYSDGHRLGCQGRPRAHPTPSEKRRRG